MTNTLQYAQQLDANDELRHFRERFFIPQHKGKDKVYFTGNSLGLQPKSVKDYLQQELDDWANLGGEGHTHANRPWIPYHEFFAEQLAKIVGASPAEVVTMNSLTVNLHLLMVSFYQPTKERYKIICEAKAFPSDQYAFETQALHHGLNPDKTVIDVKPRDGEQLIRKDDILAAIEEHGKETALVLFSGVNYYTGQVFDMPAITKAAHDAGALCGFDLAHAVGNIELKMHEWNIDFACWCTYKYLNSGPGAVGGAYIHKRHASNKDINRFAGWWGYKKDTRFAMDKGFEPIPTAEGWQLSNAPVLSMAAHKASLDIIEEAGIDKLVKKGLQLSAYFFEVMRDVNEKAGGNLISIITPEAENERGCQVSIVIKEKGKKVYEHLMENGVSAGWREPEVIRVAAVPLYNSFEEVYRFGQLVLEAMEKVD